MLIPPFLATSATFTSCAIVRNEQLARDTYRLRVESPEIAERIRPGQFVMLRLAGCDDPLIGRPLALFDTYQGVDGATLGLDLVYLVAGKLTTRLSGLTAGSTVEVWGPLGNGFSNRPCQRLVMVAGGIGHTPFLAVAQSALGRKSYGASTNQGLRNESRAIQARATAWAEHVVMCYGVRSANLFAGLELFEEAGVDLRLATDDGTRGHHGFVTDVILPELDAVDVRVLCCGPEPMMAAVARICHDAGVACDVSLETPMACGFGACFSCVAPVRDAPDSPEWDYKRTCVEGPVFDSRRIAWTR